MDGTRFDDLTRRFGQLLSRRRLLALSAGVALSPVVRGRTVAQQNLCESDPPCPTDYNGISGNCFTFETTAGECACLKSVMFMVCEHGDACSTDNECGVDMLCGDTGCSDGLGRCYRVCPDRETPSVCDEGLVNCEGQCRDLSTDFYHCGECGYQCSYAGENPSESCVDGQCVCPPEFTGKCGQDYCTNEQVDWNNCGVCGNQCVQGETCCDGRCVARESAERFCDGCGYLARWPQGCLEYETCDGGMCVASGSFTEPLVVVTCAERLMLPDLPQIEDPHAFVAFWIQMGCWPEENITVEARTNDGILVDSCVTVGGVCSISGNMTDLPLTLTEIGIESDVHLDWPNELTSGNIASVYPTQLVNIGGSPGPATNLDVDSDVLPPTGYLAYSVKNDDHWDIWVYSFDTQQNAQLTNGPTSDQWAPAYSHDGTRLAYLSDETDGSNQIWLMDPDGGNQRQITDWHGAESILYVGWSPDDAQLIVTLFGDVRRLVLMPSGGGAFTDYVGLSSSFATTGTNGGLVYSTEEDPGGTAICLTAFANPACSASAFGDTPNLTPDGQYVTFQLGDPGGRHIEILKLGGGPLPNIPRVADDSNPVWLTQTHTFLAFVSSNGVQETVQVNRLHDDFATPIEIAPHDRVWYLSKRFTGEPTMPPTTQLPESVETLPTLEPLPDETGTGAGSGFSGLTGRVEFRALTCTGAETEFSVNGPAIALDYGPPCSPMAVPQRMNIQGDNGYRTVIMAPASLDLQMGQYTVTHVVSGVTETFDLVPNDAFIQSCSGNPDCLYQWFVTFVTDVDATGQESGNGQTQSSGTGSLEVHLVDCPPGFFGPDYYAVCHDNGIGQMEFILESESVYEETSAVIEQSPGPGIARFWDLAPGTYGLDLRTKFVKAPAYVFCSPDQGETVLVDRVLADYHDPVLVPVNGQAVVCDWNMLN